jgi:hypothetical protein
MSGIQKDVGLIEASTGTRPAASAAYLNKPDAANPAIAFVFHAGCQWRGVADPGRWQAIPITDEQIN